MINYNYYRKEIVKIMLSKDDFEKLINNLRDKLDETTVALVSEEILATLSAYNNGFDEYEKSVEEVEKLKSEKTVDEIYKYDIIDIRYKNEEL